MSFNIYVKFLSGRTAEVAISSDMRVAELPRLINPLLDPANCRFMWAGMSMDLNGTRTFADYHIAGTCSIHCVFRIPSPASGATVEAHRAANDGLEGCTMTSVGTATPVVYPSAAMKAEWMEPGTQCDSAWSYFATVALGADDGSTLALGLCHSSLDRRLSRMVSADAASALREGKVVTTLPGGVELRQQLCAEEAVFTRGAETVAVAGALVAHAVPPDRICLQKDVYIADSLSLWSADALMASSGRGVDGSMAHFRNLDVNPGSLQVLHDRDGLLCVVFEASGAGIVVWRPDAESDSEAGLLRTIPSSAMMARASAALSKGLYVAAHYWVAVFDVTGDGRKLATLNGHGDAITAVQRVAGATVATLSQDRTVLVWDLNGPPESWRCRASLEFKDTVPGVPVSPSMNSATYSFGDGRLGVATHDGTSGSDLFIFNAGVTTPVLIATWAEQRERARAGSVTSRSAPLTVWGGVPRACLLEVCQQLGGL